MCIVEHHDTRSGSRQFAKSLEYQSRYLVSMSKPARPSVAERLHGFAELEWNRITELGAELLEADCDRLEWAIGVKLGATELDHMPTLRPSHRFDLTNETGLADARLSLYHRDCGVPCSNALHCCTNVAELGVSSSQLHRAVVTHPASALAHRDPTVIGLRIESRGRSAVKRKLRASIR